MLGAIYDYSLLTDAEQSAAFQHAITQKNRQLSAKLKLMPEVQRSIATDSYSVGVASKPQAALKNNTINV